MTKHKHHSIPFILFTRIAGFIFFLLILFLLNILVDVIDNDIFDKAVELLNNNFVLILSMSILFLIAEIFAALIFPLDIPAPVFAALGSLFLVTFAFKVAEFIDLILEKDIYETLTKFSYVIYGATFLIVLIGGYIEVFRKLFEPEEPQIQTVIVQPVQQEGPKSWKDIRNEFRQTVSDFLALIRDKINKKRTK